MSADNGVYILPVKDTYGNVTWFVNHMQAVENLNYLPNCGDYNTMAVLKFVVEADKFKVRAFALEAAHDMVSKLSVCEYGVNILPEFCLPLDLWQL